jgi:beta-lactamase class A
MQDLVAKLNALCDEHPFTTTWYFKALTSGFTADRAGDQVVPSASTRKISIMMAALAACHAGNLNLDDPFTIDKEYQDTDSGTFQFRYYSPTHVGRDASLGGAARRPYRQGE